MQEYLEDLLSVYEAAQYLHKTEAAIRNLIRSKGLTPIKIKHAVLLSKNELKRFAKLKGIKYG